MKPNYLTNDICGKCENWKKKRGGKGKVKKIYRNEILTSAGVVYFSLTLSDQVFNNFFFTMYVLSQTLTNAARPILWKWTNAIRMHFALIPRAHTTVLAILRLLEMVLIVKVSLVLEGDVICILFPMLKVVELTFIRNSHRRSWLSSGIHIEEA